MFGIDHYVCVLKGKGGEFNALRDLNPGSRSGLTPLIEVPDVGWNFEDDTPSSDVTVHLEKVAKKLRDSWGTTHPVFADVLPEPDYSCGARQPVEIFFDHLRSFGVLAVPVVGLRDSGGYRAAVARIDAMDGRGCCIRSFDAEMASRTFPAELSQLLGDVGLSAADVDFIADMGDLNGAGTNTLARAAELNLVSLPTIGTWRSLTTVLSSFPENLSGVGRGVSRIERTDVLAYRQLVATGRMSRLPTYGDYGPDNPNYLELDPRILQPAASIRYTIDDDWLIARGRALRGPRGLGFSQYRDLARLIVAEPEYCGRAFSAADEKIDDCASNVGTTGNLQTWRFVAVNHHLEFVLDRLASHGGP